MKPYLVVCVSDGVVGCIYQRNTWDEAVALAAALAKRDFPTYDQEEICRQLEENMEFYDDSTKTSITLAQTEDDD